MVFTDYKASGKILYMRKLKSFINGNTIVIHWSYVGACLYLQNYIILLEISSYNHTNYKISDLRPILKEKEPQ